MAETFLNKFIKIIFLIGFVLVTGCNTFDVDFERDNPSDPVNPKIEILSPVNPFINYHGDLFTLELKVQDAFTPHSELKITLYSDKDGLLDTIQANQSGVATSQLSGLSKNVHYLTAEVINNSGGSARDTTLLYNTAPPKVNITEAKLVKNSFIQLNWDTSPDPDFEFYKLYRVNSLQDTTLLAEISDVAVTSFKDFAPLDSLYRYHINTLSSSFDLENRSNISTVTRTLFTESQYYSPSVYKYPGQPALLVTKDSNLAGYNYDQDSFFGVISETEMLRPGITSIVGDNGQGMEIYTISKGRTEVRIYDAFSMEFKESGNFNSNLTAIATDNRGNIIIQIGISHAMLFVSKRGQFPISNNYVGISGGILRVTQSTNDIYIASTSGSPSSLLHASYDNNGNMMNSTGWPYHGGPPLSSSSFEVHPHGEFIITAFTGHIYEKAPSLEHSGALNHNGRYVDFAFNNSGNLLFAADGRGWVDIYDELNFVEKVEIDAFPVKVFYDDGELIIFGESTILKDYYGVSVLSTDQSKINYE